MFRKIKGQDKVVRILQRAIEENRIAQGYLFYGPEGVGKFTTALYLGMALNCYSEHEKKPCGVCNSCQKFLKLSHPDLIYLFPIPNMDLGVDGDLKAKDAKHITEYNEYMENKVNTPYKEFFFSTNTAIRIESVRMLQHRVSFSANEAKYKTIIIEGADQMTEEASNAFLKTLEEPPPNTIIVLTTTKVNSLLPTIISRCQKVAFNSLNPEVIEEELTNKFNISATAARIYARISNGNLEKAIKLTEDGKIETLQVVTEFIKLVLEQDDLKTIEFISNFKGIKNGTLFKDMISYLQLYLYDITMFLNGQELVNVDKVDLVKIAVARNPYLEDRIPELMNFLEEMRYRFEGHVNPQLILTEVYFTLNEVINETKIN